MKDNIGVRYTNQGQFKTEPTSGLSAQDVLEYSRKDDGALFSVKENTFLHQDIVTCSIELMWQLSCCIICVRLLARLTKGIMGFQLHILNGMV